MPSSKWIFLYIILSLFFQFACWKPDLCIVHVKLFDFGWWGSCIEKVFTYLSFVQQTALKQSFFIRFLFFSTFFLSIQLKCGWERKRETGYKESKCSQPNRNNNAFITQKSSIFCCCFSSHKTIYVIQIKKKATKRSSGRKHKSGISRFTTRSVSFFHSSVCLLHHLLLLLFFVLSCVNELLKGFCSHRYADKQFIYSFMRAFLKAYESASYVIWIYIYIQICYICKCFHKVFFSYFMKNPNDITTNQIPIPSSTFFCHRSIKMWKRARIM